MSPGAAIGTVDIAGTFAESGVVVTMTASADATGIWENISTTGNVTSVDSPTLSNEYVYGSYVDEPLALINSGGTFFYAGNRVYSPAAMTDVWGAVVERYRYDSYGNRTVMLADDSAPKTTGLIGNQRGFTGYYLDQESGLYYARARMYSPELGRFLERDNNKRSKKCVVQPKPLHVTSYDISQSNVTVNLSRFTDEEKSECQWQAQIARAGYSEGMNLYSAYFVPGKTDPTGETCVVPCGIFLVKENDGWIENHSIVQWGNNSSAGFGPLNGTAAWPTAGQVSQSDVQGSGEWSTVGDSYDSIQYGTCSSCETCKRALDNLATYIKDTAANPNNYYGLGYNCHTWASDAITATGLCQCNDYQSTDTFSGLQFFANPELMLGL